MLNHSHRKQLEESGIDTKFAEANGLRSVTGAYIKKRFGWNVSDGGMEILYPESATSYRSDFSRIRLDVPINVKPGSQSGTYHSKQRTVRYLSPKESINHLYIPKDVWKVLRDPSVPLYFCEGEKKALKLVCEGYMAIGLVGIYGAYSQGKLLDDFDRIILVGREIYLAFDGDKFSNLHVQRAEEKLAQDLLERAHK